MTTTERQTLDCMMKYGGSVIKALAQCYIAADPWNRAQIKSTWFIEWQRYAAMADDNAKARAQ
jgi:hypothetical protein